MTMKLGFSVEFLEASIATAVGPQWLMVSMSKRLQIVSRTRGMQGCLIGGIGLREGGEQRKEY